MEREAPLVLPHEEIGDERRAVGAAAHDLVAHRGSLELGVAVVTADDLLDVEPHDHLARDQIDHLGRLVRDARALLAAGRTRPLARRHPEGIVHTSQPWRDRSAHGRLLWRLRCLGPAAVLLRRLVELLVRVGEGTARQRRELVEEEIELVGGDVLAAIPALTQLTEQDLELVIAGHELGDERNHLVVVTADEQRAEDVEHRATQLLRPRLGGTRGRLAHAQEQDHRHDPCQGLASKFS